MNIKTIPMVHSSYWSDLSWHPRNLLDEEGIENIYFEMIKMNRSLNKIDQNCSNHLIGQWVYLDRYKMPEDRLILEHWRQSHTYLGLFSDDPICDVLMGSFSPACKPFVIRNLENDQLIGEIALQDIDWGGKNANLGISIGRKECWGKGYGTDAVRVIMRYAFHQLGLIKVSLKIR